MKTKKNFLTFAVAGMIAMIAVACIFVSMSCSKDSNSTMYSYENKSTTVLPYNSDNRLDSIGIMHNIHLNDVISKINLTYVNPNVLSTKDVLDIYREYLIDHNYKSNEIDFAFNIISNDFEFTQNVNRYIVSLQDSISIIPNDSYLHYKNLICRYENRIMGDAMLTEIEEGTLLAYTSVLRHSIFYWYESPTKAIPNWLKIAGADAEGAATGLAGGATLGWGGAILGATLGAVGSSLKKAEELEKLDTPADSTATIQNQ